MPTLLALDVSPRGGRSISRALGKRFVEQWQARNPGGTVIYRDLNITIPAFTLGVSTYRAFPTWTTTGSQVCMLHLTWSAPPRCGRRLRSRPR